MNFKQLKNNFNQRTASKLALSTFKLTIDKSYLKTPHYIMSRVYDMVESRPSVQTGLQQIILFLTSNISFKSDDEKSLMIATKWWESRDWLEDEMESEMASWLAVGTSYIEPMYNSNGAISNFYHVPDSSKIYFNVEFKNEDEDYWILEVPLNVKSVGDKIARHFHYNYVQGQTYGTHIIYGVPYPKKKFIQRVMKGGRDPNYGWGLLSSAVDNDDVLREILKNWALMAKYRALARKILGFYNENGEPVDADEIEDIKNDFLNLEEEDSLIVNKKINSTDLSFTGQDNSMGSEADSIRRENSNSLIPNYMSAWSQDNSLGTAREAKVPFSLKLKSLDNKNKKFYNNIIIKQGIKIDHPWVSDDLTISFGEPDLYSIDEKLNVFMSMYNSRLITFNEFRKSMGFDTVNGGDKWGSEPPLDKISVSKTLDNVTLKNALEKFVKESGSFKESFNKLLKEKIPIKSKEPLKLLKNTDIESTHVNKLDSNKINYLKEALK